MSILSTTRINGNLYTAGKVAASDGTNWGQYKAYSASGYYRAFEADDQRIRLDVRNTTSTADRRFVDIYSGSQQSDNDLSIQICRDSSTNGFSSTYVATQNWVKENAMYHCIAKVTGTNTKPFHRIATTGVITGTYQDRTSLLYIGRDFETGSPGGFLRINLRTNDSNSASTCSAKWISRSNGFDLSKIQIAFNNTFGNTYCDIFYKSSGVYDSIIVRDMGSSNSRNAIGRGWTLINSEEISVYNSTLQKNEFSSSKECWASIADAGTALHGSTYPSTTNSTDLEVNSATPATSSNSTSIATTAWANSWISSKLLNLVYPVGSIYMSVNSVSPQTFLGGTWVQLKDTFLLAHGDTYTSTASATATQVKSEGGAASVSLSESHLPKHTHSFTTSSTSKTLTGSFEFTDNDGGDNYWVRAKYGDGVFYTGRSGSGNFVNSDGTKSGSYNKAIFMDATHTHSGTTGEGNGTASAHNNMPPYLTVYMWKRTA